MYDLNPLMSGYIDEHRHSLTLEKHEELVLLAQNGDREARDTLVIDNLALVIHAARPFCKCGMDFDDLFQEGCIALMNTIDIFKPGLGRFFSTFTYDKIRWGISRSVINKAGIIWVPLHVKELCIKLEHLNTELTRELNSVPSVEDLAAAAGVTVEKAHRALLSAERPLSLEYPYGDEYEPIGSRIPDGNAIDPEETVIEGQIEGIVRDAVRACLTEREYLVIQHRFGFDDCEILPLWKPGEMLGISMERVRQIEVEAKGKIKIKWELWERGVTGRF